MSESSISWADLVKASDPDRKEPPVPVYVFEHGEAEREFWNSDEDGGPYE